MIDRKYYAGMIDADGSVSVNFRKLDEDEYAVYPTLGIYQKNDKGLMLSTWANEWDVGIHKNHHWSVLLQGDKAIRALEQTKQHMVIKQNVADLVIPLHQTRVNKEGCKEIRSLVKELRTQGSDKNFPSRRWLAGYIDGDGCIASNYQKRRGVTYFFLEIVAHESQTAGLLLCQKAYGGSIYTSGNCKRWKIFLNVERANTILAPLAKHLKIKKDQAEYAIHSIRSGNHLKTEKALAVHETMRSLKRANND